MTGNERHYISEPQSNGGCERERLVSYFKNTTQFTVTDGEGRGEGKVQDQVPRRWNVALFPPREPRETSRRSRAGSNVLARVRSTRTWSVAIPTERKSGQRNYVTLRKRASIASVSNVSAKRSVNERKEQKKPIKTEREKEVRVLIIHMMSAMSLGDRSIH